MTPVFTARKRAEEFAALLEDSSSAGGFPNARYAEFIEIVGALRETPQVQARPEFVANLRDALMSAADTALVPSPAQTVNDRLTITPRRTARERRLAVAVGGFAIVGATTSMAMAAQSALPGDALYPLKRAIENAHTGFSVDDGTKGTTLLSNASGRLDEVDAMSRNGAVDAGEATQIAQTLATFTEQASQASELLISDFENTGHQGSIAELRDFTADSMASLTALQALVPDQARAALIKAAQVLTQIDTQALDLCPSCGGEGITQIPPAFAAGTAVEDLLASLASSLSLTPVVETRASGRGKHGGKHQNEGTPVVPVTPEPPSSPGSVLDPSQPSPQDSDPGTPSDDPLGEILDSLPGGTSTSTPTSDSSEAPPLGDVLTGVTDSVGDVIDELTHPLNP